MFITEIKKRDISNSKDYFNRITSISSLKSLKLSSPITFFVGENGTGKSTFLEAIAVSSGFNAEGGSRNYNFSTFDSHSGLFEYITLVKSARRPKDGFFLRAESFYNVSTYAAEIDLNVNEFGEKELHAQSHGESIFNLVVNRFRGNGLYLLDEPEAALSPQRQLSLIVAINDLVKNGSQFIIATHSPILLGMDNSDIFSFDGEIRKIEYEQTESFKTTKMFIENRNVILNRLID